MRISELGERHVGCKFVSENGETRIITDVGYHDGYGRWFLTSESIGLRGWATIYRDAATEVDVSEPSTDFVLEILASIKDIREQYRKRSTYDEWREYQAYLDRRGITREQDHAEAERAVAVMNWMEEHGYDAMGASDMIGDAVSFARANPAVPVEFVRDAWWASPTGERKYYPNRGH